MCVICDSIGIVSELSPAYTKQVAGLYDGIAAQIWQGKFNGTIHEELTRVMAAEFHNTIEQTYGHSLDGMKITNEHFTFLSKAERSAYEFSTAKCAQLIKDMKVIAGRASRPEDFHAVAGALYTNMTEKYQETERIFAEGEVNKAIRWREIQANKKEFPIGEYVAVHDDRVRAAHFAIDGTRLPWNHPWWKTHRPPIDYRCRCKAIQDFNISNLTAPDKLIQYAVPKQFVNEALDKGVIFSKEHSYFKKQDHTQLSMMASDVAPWRSAGKGVNFNSFHQTDAIRHEVPFGQILSKALNTDININPYFNKGKHADYLINTRLVTEANSLVNKIDLKNVSTNSSGTIREALRRAKKQAESVVISLDAPAYTEQAIIKAAKQRRSFKAMVFIHKGKWAKAEFGQVDTEAFRQQIQKLLK